MKQTEVRREFQIVAEEECYENIVNVVYGIVMTEFDAERAVSEQVSSISTRLRTVSALTEKLRSTEPAIVHFKDIVSDYLSEL